MVLFVDFLWVTMHWFVGVSPSQLCLKLIVNKTLQRSFKRVLPKFIDLKRSTHFTHVLFGTLVYYTHQNTL